MLSQAYMTATSRNLFLYSVCVPWLNGPQKGRQVVVGWLEEDVGVQEPEAGSSTVAVARNSGVWPYVISPVGIS